VAFLDFSKFEVGAELAKQRRSDHDCDDGETKDPDWARRHQEVIVVDGMPVALGKAEVASHVGFPVND
jgi:hypothetical protein